MAAARPRAMTPMRVGSAPVETVAERGRAVQVGLILLACGAGLAALWLAREVVLLGFLGVLIAVVFSFPVGWLSRVLPRALAAPVLQREMEQLRESAPRAIERAQGWVRRVQSATGTGGSGEKGQAAQKAPEVAAKVGEKAVPALV